MKDYILSKLTYLKDLVMSNKLSAGLAVAIVLDYFINHR